MKKGEVSINMIVGIILSLILAGFVFAIAFTKIRGFLP